MQPKILSGEMHDAKSLGVGYPARSNAERRDWRSMASPHYTRVQLFFPESGSYSETGSTSVHVRTGGEWQTFEISLPADAPDGRLRLDPADAHGIIEIAEIQVVNPDWRQPIWRSGVDSQFSVLGTAVRLRREGLFTILSYGVDPVLLLPVVEGVPAGSALRVRMRALIGEPVFSGFVKAVIEECLAISPSTVARELVSVALTSPQEAARMLDDMQAQLREVEQELSSSQQERARALEILDALRGKLTGTESAAEQFRDEAQDHARRTVELERELETIRAEAVQSRSALASAKTERDEARAVQESMFASWSWRLTAPLRFGGALFRRR